MPAAPRRVVIEGVAPSTPDRVSAAKATVGRPVDVSAAVFADGHDVVAARVRWRRGRGRWNAAPMEARGDDRFAAVITPNALGAHDFEIDGWVDGYGTWRHRVTARIEARVAVDDELETGARLIEAELDRLVAPTAEVARRAADQLRAGDVTASLDPALGRALAALPDRTGTSVSGPWRLWVDRERGAIGAWYELFPRSYGGLQGAVKRLAAVADMGFDVVYLPPVHPIGTTARKGRDNALRASADDPGSPWAIGSEAGGHEAIEPALGTVDDFADFVAEAARLGLEVALDYALQCSPDHPWVRDHPAWFSRRADGSIRFAENPPKQYQDVYPVNLLPDRDEDRIELWHACRDVVEVWIGRGVRIFRVDNPHTKPFDFWAWLIADVHRRYPDIVFLAEAFTRPAVMHRLAEIGFTQSYTYFTWRTSKSELVDYGEELARGPHAAYFRPNLWTNTPDILAGVLRGGPPAAFKLRAVLAATLGPSWGVYSGYELCENRPASETNEEYAASEKYEIKRRDFDRPDSIAPYIARLNDIRRRHPALSDLASLRFHHTTSEALIAYSKRVGDDVVVTVVNLDPYATHEANLWIDLAALGLPWDEPLDAHDELGGHTYAWTGPEPYVRIGPDAPAHVIHLQAKVAS
ncbi:MAG: alpha-1,4-glucan--maltose-1-phosphate maltosyltransferase [Acidimicrobiales bacterium]